MYSSHEVHFKKNNLFERCNANSLSFTMNTMCTMRHVSFYCVLYVLYVLVGSTVALQQHIALHGIARHLKQSFANASASNVTSNYFNRSTLHDHVARQPATKLHIKRERPCKHWSYLLKCPVTSSPPSPPPTPVKEQKKQKKQCQPDKKHKAWNFDHHPFGF